MSRLRIPSLLLILVVATDLSAQSSVAFLRGDANADGVVNISDPSFILNALFTGGRQPDCDDAADANDDGLVDISDPTNPHVVVRDDKTYLSTGYYGVRVHELGE